MDTEAPGPLLFTGAPRYEPGQRPPAIDEGYRGPTWWPLSRILKAASHPGTRAIAFVWLAVNGAAIAASVRNVALGWNGVPVVLSLLCAVWLGPWWGIIPASLANLAAALAIGVAWPMALAFALAGGLGPFVFWGSMVTLNVAPDLRRGRDLRRLLAVAVIATACASLAGLVWNIAQGRDALAGLPSWRDSVAAHLLLTLLVAAPLLRLLGAPVRRWIERLLASPSRYEVSYWRTALFAFVVLAVLCALAGFGFGRLGSSVALGETPPFLGLVEIALVLAAAVFSATLARLGERQRGLARRESLTGCFNRRAFYELFPREADRSRRLGQGIALVFLDVDHFKQINDRLGHETGDRVLQQITSRVQGVIRETDLLFRWGGEEFVLLLSHTAADDAFSLAERVRAAVADRPFLSAEVSPALAVTVSLGTSGTSTYPVAPEDLLTRADAACYRAKAQGRNRVVVGEIAPPSVLGQAVARPS